ncbi:hypothetical protein DFH27DRAFT_598919 [Peziza echinospora]|nr:hypothetical protein DFH27DRAFT_598919 [Peziza echinospora]
MERGAQIKQCDNREEFEGWPPPPPPEANIRDSHCLLNHLSYMNERYPADRAESAWAEGWKNGSRQKHEAVEAGPLRQERMEDWGVSGHAFLAGSWPSAVSGKWQLLDLARSAKRQVPSLFGITLLGHQPGFPGRLAISGNSPSLGRSSSLVRKRQDLTSHYQNKRGGLTRLEPPIFSGHVAQIRTWCRGRREGGVHPIHGSCALGSGIGYLEISELAALCTSTCMRLPDSKATLDAGAGQPLRLPSNDHSISTSPLARHCKDRSEATQI